MTLPDTFIWLIGFLIGAFLTTGVAIGITKSDRILIHKAIKEKVIMYHPITGDRVLTKDYKGKF